MAAVLKRRMVGLLLLLSAILSACGVRIEVAPTHTPVPVLSPTPSPVSPADWGVIRQVASPHVSFFAGGEPQGTLFINTNPPDVLLIKGKSLALTISYDVTWYTTSAGSARLRLNGYVLSDQQWVPFDNSEEELGTKQFPANLRDMLDVGFTRDTVGQFRLRAEVEGVVRSPAGNLGSQAQSAELNVFILSDPGEVDQDSERLTPKIGELKPSIPLYNWRAWHGGPCTLQSTTEAVQTAIKTACEASKNGNVEALANALDAARAADQNRDIALDAQIVDMLGLILSEVGQYDSALAAFRASADAWRNMDRTSEFSASAMNAACSQAMAGDSQGAENLLSRLLELYAQYNDDAGRYLAEANLGRLTNNRDMVQEAKDYFDSVKLPQLAIAEAWIAEIEAASK